MRQYRNANNHRAELGALTSSLMRLRRQRSTHHRADDVPRQPERAQQQYGGNNSGRSGRCHDSLAVGLLSWLWQPQRYLQSLHLMLGLLKPWCFALHMVASCR